MAFDDDAGADASRVQIGRAVSVDFIVTRIDALLISF